MGKIENIINNYKTRYSAGFIKSEMEEILKEFPEINMDKYNDAMLCHTVQISETNETIYYHTDFRTALYCGVENRDMTTLEWD